MCLGGGGTAKIAKPKYKNNPVTVTGEQIGVDDPKDTKKVTDELKIQRQKEEGIYVDPNLTTTDTLTRSGGRGFSGNRSAARDRAKNMARARLGKKFGSSPTGRKTGVA